MNIAAKTTLILRCLAICFLLSLSSCASSRKPLETIPAFTRLPQREQDFYIDAYQEMFAWRGDNFPKFGRYCVEFKYHDAPPDLIEALRQKGFQTYPSSRWRQGRGMHCELAEIEWLSPIKVRLKGGWLYGSLGGQWGHLVFTKQGGHWKMISFVMEEIA